ncbi:MAG: hypothetical protein AAGA47_13065, partial [Pseudomonadota bacterium]
LLRAARGARVPLGYAEDMARAVGDFGDEAAFAAAARALSKPFEKAKFEEADGVLTFKSAPAIAALPVALDALRAGIKTVTFDCIDEEDLIAPYLDHSAARGFFAAKHGVRLTHTAARSVPPPIARLHLPIDTLETLQALAALTYVPASEASREGAGAGAIDND